MQENLKYAVRYNSNCFWNTLRIKMLYDWKPQVDFDLYYVTVLWQVQPQIKKLKPKISIRCKTALSNSNWTKASKYLKEYMLSAVIIYEVKQHCSAKSRHNTARSTHDAAWAVSPLHPALICTILDSFYWCTDFKFWWHMSASGFSPLK